MIKAFPMYPNNGLGNWAPSCGINEPVGISFLPYNGFPYYYGKSNNKKGKKMNKKSKNRKGRKGRKGRKYSQKK